MTAYVKNRFSWAILLCQYVLAIIGMVLASKIGAMILGIIFFNFGLNLTLYTLLWAITFCIEFIFILYLVIFLFQVKSGRFLISAFVISVILCAVSITIIFISRGTKDCLDTDAFMMCVTAGYAWPIFGFSIGSSIIAFTNINRNARN